MFAQIVLGSFLWLYGGASILFAFREVPAPIRFLFPLKLPLIFALVLLFVREEHTAKAGRLCLGAIFLLAALVTFGRLVYHLLFGWG